MGQACDWASVTQGFHLRQGGEAGHLQVTPSPLRLAERGLTSTAVIDNQQQGGCSPCSAGVPKGNGRRPSRRGEVINLDAPYSSSRHLRTGGSSPHPLQVRRASALRGRLRRTASAAHGSGSVPQRPHHQSVPACALPPWAEGHLT